MQLGDEADSPGGWRAFKAFQKYPEAFPGYSVKHFCEIHLDHKERHVLFDYFLLQLSQRRPHCYSGVTASRIGDK